jgi:hypothetical protein
MYNIPYEDRHDMLGNEETMAWLTAHAAVGEWRALGRSGMSRAASISGQTVKI